MALIGALRRGLKSAAVPALPFRAGPMQPYCTHRSAGVFGTGTPRQVISFQSLKWDMGGEGQDPPSALAVITPPSRPNQLPSIPASPPLSACLPQDPLIPEEVGFYPFLFLSGLPLHKTLTPNLTLVLKVFVLTALILGVIKYPGVQIKDPGPSSGV